MNAKLPTRSNNCQGCESDKHIAAEQAEAASVMFSGGSLRRLLRAEMAQA